MRFRIGSSGRTWCVALTCAACALLSAGRAEATVPQTFTVQGVLRNSQGQLQSMPINLNVTLYDAQMDPSNALFQPPQITNLPVTNGLFSVVVTIPDQATMNKIASAPEIWVGITAGNDLFPRQKVTPVVSALLCGNADTVTNGVYTTGNYSDPAWITSLAGSKISGAVASATNASTVTNGVYTTGSYADPAWITSLAGAKITGAVTSATNATTVTNGVYTSSSYADPAWITSLAGSKISGAVASATNASQLGGQAPSFYVDSASNQTAIGGNKTFTGNVSVGGVISGKGSGLSAIGGANLNSGGSHAHGISFQYVQGAQVALPAGSRKDVCASCPSGYVATGGTCYTNGAIGAGASSINILATYMNSTSYCCSIENDTTTYNSPGCAAQVACIAINAAGLP
jgi:hypothetical protein